MSSAVVTVTTTATLLCTAKPGSQRQWVTIENDNDQPHSVRVGGSDVTATTGHELAPGRGLLFENDTLSKPAAPALYGIVASGTVDVTVTQGI